jgi:hypothetical protein
MRQGVWLLVAGVGLAAAGQGHAQFGMTSSNTSQFRGVTRTIGSNSYVGSPFRLRDLFPSLTPVRNRGTVGSSSIPDPNSPEYLKLFGYKRLY